ncbi:hypothetical protein HanIR_Chr11g0546281 [Helianthus annuus]|nr:hypothetical protein HanIR_Chr11g0546281 [Helianthus annuus]
MDAGRVSLACSLRGPRGNQFQQLYKERIGFQFSSLISQFSITISVEGLLYSGIIPPN